MKNLILLTCIFVLTAGFKAFSQTQYNATTYHQFNTSWGWVQIGAQNSSWAHMYTDRPAIIFNKPIYLLGGGLSSYSTQDLNLQTGGTTKLTLENNGYIRLKANTFLSSAYYINFGESMSEDTKRLRIGHNGTHAYIDFMDNLNFRANKNWISSLILFGNGSVGIGFGTTYNVGDYRNIGYKLAVNGGIICEEVKVITDVPDADYVFDPEYDLRTITELENFVVQNKHLPNIPSAEQFKKDGYSIGEMDEMLLRKVEELTLYVIELEKKYKYLESKTTTTSK
jgi:hypothetical protein